MVTFALAALASASAAYWVLKGWGTSAPSAALPVAVASASPVDPLAVARALGGGQVVAALQNEAPPAASRYALTGVVADQANRGAALISVDGKMAKPVRVGSPLDGGLVLKSVAGRRAVLATGMDAPAAVTLELPPPPGK